MTGALEQAIVVGTVTGFICHCACDRDMLGLTDPSKSAPFFGGIVVVGCSS